MGSTYGKKSKGLRISSSLRAGCIIYQSPGDSKWYFKSRTGDVSGPYESEREAGYQCSRLYIPLRRYG